jgi:hypothetical protein
MKALEAMNLFHGREKFNCAQSVLKAFQIESGVSEDTIQAAAIQGGGRAPEGVCGALHAARVILKNGPVRDSIEKDFAAKAGSTQCWEIREMRTLPCRGCVALSAHLLEQRMDTEKYQNFPPHHVFMGKVGERAFENGDVQCPGCAEIQ